MASLRLWEWRFFFPLTYLQTCLSLSSTKPTPTPGHSLPSPPSSDPLKHHPILPQPHPETRGCPWQPPILSSSTRVPVPVAGLGVIQPCGLLLLPQLLPVCSREAVVSQIKALHSSQAEPHAPRSIPSALALNLGAELLQELTPHSPAAGFATSTHWGHPILFLPSLSHWHTPGAVSNLTT